MSASVAGKFQDHYVILGIEVQADQDAIQKAYELLVEKYGPDNLETANEEKLAMVTLAFEVLSDPLLRREFDKLKGVDQEGPPKFSGLAFFENRGRETGLRMALLAILYDRRRCNPYRPSLSNRNVDAMIEAEPEELALALWYLKQRGLVAADDKSSLVITIEGLEYMENDWPRAEVVLPFIKPGSVAAPVPPPEAQMDPLNAARGRRGARIVGMLRGGAAEPHSGETH